MTKTGIFLFSGFLMFASLAHAVDTQQAIARTNAMIDSIKSASKNGVLTQKNFEEFIDVNAIIDEAIEPHLAKFNKAQLKEFKDTMLTVVRKVAYPNSNDFMTTTKYKITGAEDHKEFAIVNMTVHLQKDDLDMDIGYYWRERNKQLMLTDVSFDGDSLVKDYQNQFGRIIQTDGVDGLIKKVKEKLEQVEKPSKS